jgi:hypothetical protein
MSPVPFSVLSAIFLARTLELWTQTNAKSCSSALDKMRAAAAMCRIISSELKNSARHWLNDGSRSVREEAFVRACIHPSSLAAQPPLCTRQPKTAVGMLYEDTDSTILFRGAKKPRNHGSRQQQQPQTSGRGGLPQQQCRNDLTSAFPTTRSDAQFAMPGGSDEED